MDRLAFLCIQGLLFRTAICLPTGNGYLTNINNISPMSQSLNQFNNIPNTFSETNYLANNAYTNSFVPNGLMNGSPISANEFNGNAISNNMALSGMNVPNPAINNIQVSPYISEVVPSLQYGDINMAGDLPIGGTIKVSGCFPVYGMVAVDGNVASAGTAVVAESIGNQVIDVVNKCATQYFS